MPDIIDPGSGSGGIANVETDGTIEGIGTVGDPLRLYGVVNRVIDQDISLTSGLVMINHNISINAGSTISTSGGTIYLV